MSQHTQNAEIWHEWLVSTCPPCLKRLPSGSVCAKDHPQALHTDDMSNEELAALDSHQHLKANERHQKMGKKDKICDRKQAPTKQLPADPTKVRRVCDTCHVKHAGTCKACIICKVWHKDGICPQLSLLLATTTTSTTQQQPGPQLNLPISTTNSTTQQHPQTSPTTQQKRPTCNCHHAGPCRACLTCMTFHENGICPQNLRLATDIAVNLPTEIERQTYLFKMISRVKSQEELDVIVANLLNHPDQVRSLPGDGRTTASSPSADGSEKGKGNSSPPPPQPVATTREARNRWFAKLALEMCRSESSIGMAMYLELLKDPTFLPVPKIPNDNQAEDEEEDEEEEKSQKKRRARKQRGGCRGKPAKGKAT